MKKQLLNALGVVLLLLMPTLTYAQAPPLGTAADFVLFTSAGAVTNVGTYKYLTRLTGNVGTNSGSSTNFGNVNGVMHDGDGASAQCAADLLLAYNSLSAAIPGFTLGPVIGNGTTLPAGTYSMPGTTSLNLGLTLDAQGNPNAVFIFKTPTAVAYAFTANPNSKINLINGAKACNVFWQVSGAVNIGGGATMRGNIIAHGAITMAAQDTLEGRALTVNGAITISNGALGFLAYTPIGCGSPVLTGPAAPTFVASGSYAVFATTGAATDCGTSRIIGDVGGNTIPPTGFNPDSVTGTIHFNDPSTQAAAADLLLVYNYLLGLPYDIKLLDPAEFGHNLVLTPHTYQMDAAVSFTDTLYLDAQGNTDAIFIIKTYGAFASSVGSKIILKNGTQAKNVYWFCTGAVNIGSNSVFKGAIIAHDAILMVAGTKLEGRVFSTHGALTTCGITASLPSPISSGPGDQTVCAGSSVNFIVSATGTGLSYQWRKGSLPLTNGGNISGVSNDTLIINPVYISDAAPDYNVIISGTNMPNYTSRNAVLAVNPLPVVFNVNGGGGYCTGGTGVAVGLSGSATGINYKLYNGEILVTSLPGTNAALEFGLQTTTGAYTVEATNSVTNCVNMMNGIATVTINSSPLPTLSGSADICVNSQYYYTTDQGMTGYVWTISAGGTLIGPGNGNVIQVLWNIPGDQSVSVTYANTNGCYPAVPTALFVIVNPLPGNATNINGTTTVCGGEQGVVYSTNPIPNAYNYIWTLPAGASIASGIGTPSITVNYGPYSPSGNVTMYGENLCGGGEPSSLAVTVNPLPSVAGTISGEESVCKGSTGVIYSVEPITDVINYHWTLPTGATIVSGANTNTITVNFSLSAISGNITVYGSNSCGNGEASPDFEVTLNLIPATPVATANGEVVSSNAPDGNQWYYEGILIEGATDQTYQALLSGWYWTIVTLNGCISESSNHVYVLMVGIPEVVIGGVSIYPIPNDGRFTVSITSPYQEPFTITVFSYLGVRMLEFKDIIVKKHFDQVIDLRPAVNGVYYIVIQNKGISYNCIKKVIVNQ